MDLDDCGEEVEFYMIQVADLERHVEALESAVAIALTELNTKKGGWGTGTATLMMRQLLNDHPPIQEIPPSERAALRRRIIHPLPPKQQQGEAT